MQKPLNSHNHLRMTNGEVRGMQAQPPITQVLAKYIDKDMVQKIIASFIWPSIVKFRCCLDLKKKKHKLMRGKCRVTLEWVSDNEEIEKLEGKEVT